MSSASRRPRRQRLEVLLQDDDVCAIAKPPGLATVSERWDKNATTIVDELWNLWRKDDPDAPRPYVVHRLDRDTTGVLLFARHADAQQELRRQFREREVHKQYLALTVGCPSPPQGTVEIRLDDDPRKAGKMRVVPRGGKDCTTHFSVEEVFDGFGWVALQPKTGRTHQIRVTLEHLGTPCAVDPLYGGAKALFASKWIRNYKLGRGREERPLIDRVTLHAAQITVTHPSTGAPLSIAAPLPKDLSATLKQLRRHRPLPR